MEYKCVWVKYGGWPLWPCRFADLCEVGPKLASGKESEDQVLVKFFGTPDEYAWIDEKSMKKFSLSSINEMNPLFKSGSDRKLYEAAIKEVIAWYKASEEERTIPVWKPGDEDTQGINNTSDNESSDDEKGSVGEDIDYVDVGSASMLDDDMGDTIEGDFLAGAKRLYKKKSSPQTHREAPKPKHSSDEIKHKRKVVHEVKKLPTVSHDTFRRDTKRSENNDTATSRPPIGPNKIVMNGIPHKKRPVDLVGAGISASPKKHTHTTEPTTHKSTHYSNKIYNLNDDDIVDKEKEHTSKKSKTEKEAKNEKQYIELLDEVEKQRPMDSPTSPRSPLISDNNNDQNQGNLNLQYDMEETPNDKRKQNQKTEGSGETRKQLEVTEKRKHEQISNSNEYPKTKHWNDTTTSHPTAQPNNYKHFNNYDTNHDNDDEFVPDTPPQELLRGEITKESTKLKKYVDEKLDHVQKSLDSNLYEMVSKIVEDKLQGKADKLWDQQTTFEDRMKNHFKNEMNGVRKEIASMQTELDKNLKEMEENNKGVTRAIVSLLKETVVKLEQYCT